MNYDDLKDFQDQIEQEKIFLKQQNELADNDKYRTDTDGTVYEFDPQKKAWFPKIDEDFIANYQYNYGNTPTTSLTINNQTSENQIDSAYWENPPEDINSTEYKEWYEKYMAYFYSQSNEEISCNVYNNSAMNDSNLKFDEMRSKSTAKRKPTAIAAVTEASWFEIPEEKNTNVFVSDLPSDFSEDAFIELMKKVGLLAYDPILRKPKIKFYKDEQGNFTGNARCCYLKTESVELALKIVDGSDVNGKKIRVERAKFELKGNYDPSKRRRKLTKQEKKRIKEKHDKLLGWQPEKNEGRRPKYERVVILKHVFRPKEFEDDPAMMNEVSTDMREECRKFGETKKIIIYDRNEDGVVTVCFKSPEEADVCIAALNGRYFGGQQLIAANWDGKTKYLVNESEAEMDARLKKWYSYLEKDPSASANNNHTIKKDS